MYLMLQDKEVLYFDYDESIVEVINTSLAPFCMRYKFKTSDSICNILYNMRLLDNYFSNRVLSLARDNAKQLFGLFGIPQSNDIETRIKICLACNGVSIQDSYWIKKDNSNLKFKDVNIRNNYFKEIVDIALVGLNPTITINPNCPELTTHGLFRKAWIRGKDGIYLLKSDRHTQNINTRMEVLASKILTCFSNKIECVEYEGRYRQTKAGRLYVDKCKSFGNDIYSFVEAYEITEAGFDLRRYIDYFSKEKVASIGVLDFILSNTDRHTQNYGFFMDNETGEIISLAPLFDFNCALVSDVFHRDASDTLSQMFNDGRTLKQIAEDYKHYSKLVLNINKFNNIRKNNKEFDYVFDNILHRCNLMKVKIDRG